MQLQRANLAGVTYLLWSRRILAVGRLGRPLLGLRWGWLIAVPLASTAAARRRTLLVIHVVVSRKW